MAYAPFDLSSKKVLITGGNSGIGLGMAEAVADAGADVVIWGTNAEKLADAVKGPAAPPAHRTGRGPGRPGVLCRREVSACRRMTPLMRRGMNARAARPAGPASGSSVAALYADSATEPSVVVATAAQ